MRWLAACILTVAALLFANPASSVTVDLVDGQGTLDWVTDISVTSPFQNTAVDHPLFPGNRHTHEGWFLYLPDFDVLHEFTNFTKTSNGTSQDSLNSSFSFLNETFVLDLTYGISAVGPDGLPDLAWSGAISRLLAPASPFPIITGRLFNVFDYDVGDIPGDDSATTTVTANPNTTLIEIAGAGGVTGQRGALGAAGYSADTLANILTQVQVNHFLNSTTASGNLDVAGAFMWQWDFCSAPGVPGCPSNGGGSGSGGFGGFGGFGGYTPGPTPEPSVGMLLLGGLLFLARDRRSASSH